MGIMEQRIRELRLEKGMTQWHLARKLNFGCSAISNYENGRNQPNIETLKKLASVFEVSLDYLTGFSDERYIEGKENKRDKDSPKIQKSGSVKEKSGVKKTAS